LFKAIFRFIIQNPDELVSVKKKLGFLVEIYKTLNLKAFWYGKSNKDKVKYEYEDIKQMSQYVYDIIYDIIFTKININLSHNQGPSKFYLKIENNILTINKSIDTPNIFKHVRGSSNVVEYNNEYWVVVHGVKYTTPRKYYHMIVILNKEYKVKKYTVPFYFDTYMIEYCLGLLIEDNTIYMTASRNDSNPIIVKVKVNDINNLFI
jgi:hypothetical protein